jgi:hypothetical protein
LPGIVHGHGRSLEIPRTRNPDESIPQILLLQQDEDDKNNDDTGRSKRMD